MTALVPPYEATLPQRAELPAVPVVRGAEACRCPEHLCEVVAQFHVATAPRYAPRDGNTYCNIFAWDFTCAMGCEVPHWVDSEGNPTKPGNGRELTINATLDWLRSDAGLERGWRECGAVEAEAQASNGHPVLAVLREVPHGHVAVVMPSRPNHPGLYVSQAGGRCLEDEPLANGFGSKGPVLFFFHP